MLNFQELINYSSYLFNTTNKIVLNCFAYLSQGIYLAQNNTVLYEKQIEIVDGKPDLKIIDIIPSASINIDYKQFIDLVYSKFCFMSETLANIILETDIACNLIIRKFRNSNQDKLIIPSDLITYNFKNNLTKYLY